MTQLDLFAAEAPAEPVGPFICPWCHREERNALLLMQNHWVGEREPGEYDWPTEHGRCIAQDLTRNHVAYDVRVIQTGGTWDRSCCGQHRSYRDDCARATLARDVERAREVGVDVSDLLALVDGAA